MTGQGGVKVQVMEADRVSTVFCLASAARRVACIVGDFGNMTSVCIDQEGCVGNVVVPYGRPPFETKTSRIRIYLVGINPDSSPRVKGVGGEGKDLVLIHFIPEHPSAKFDR